MLKKKGEQNDFFKPIKEAERVQSEKIHQREISLAFS